MICVCEWTSLPISSYVCNNFWPLMKSFLVDLISSWQGKSSYIIRIYDSLFPFLFPPSFLFLFIYEPNWYCISFSLFSSLIRTWSSLFLFFSNFILSSSFIFFSLYFLPFFLLGLAKPFFSLSLSLCLYFLFFFRLFLRLVGLIYHALLISPSSFWNYVKFQKLYFFTCRGILIRKWEAKLG